MKSKMNLKLPFLSLVSGILCLMMSTELNAQEEKSTDLKDFKVIIERTQEGIKLQGVEGSAWINLSFSLKNYKPQAVDEYGMTKLKRVSSRKDPKLTDFLFTITQTETEIELKGIEGTAWTDLKFSLAENRTWVINQFGTTKL